MSFYKFYLQSDGNAGFLRAARDGNLQEVLEYLKGSTDINTSNPVSDQFYLSFIYSPSLSLLCHCYYILLLQY